MCRWPVHASIVLGLSASLACGPGQPSDSIGDELPGDGDPGDGDGETGVGDGETGVGETSGGDGDACGSLGVMMAPCNDEFLSCIDGWTCHFYDTVDMYGVTPVGNCSPPCETDADCAIGEDLCIDPNIVCASFGQDDQRRCMLPCQTDADCYSGQFCAEGMDICVTHTI